MVNTSDVSIYACCFCGLGIEPKGFDVVKIGLTTTYQARTHRQQNFFCHLDCFSKAAPHALMAVTEPDFLEE